jgi:hypothetical protein
MNNDMNTRTFKQIDMNTRTFKQNDMNTRTFKQIDMNTRTFKQIDMNTRTFKQIDMNTRTYKPIDYTTLWQFFPSHYRRHGHSCGREIDPNVPPLSTEMPFGQLYLLEGVLLRQTASRTDGKDWKGDCGSWQSDYVQWQYKVSVWQLRLVWARGVRLWVMYIVLFVLCNVHRMVHKTGAELARSFQQYNRKTARCMYRLFDDCSGCSNCMILLEKLLQFYV